MKSILKFFKPCTTVVRSWLVNISVAAFAVGLFQDIISGLILGVVLLISACALCFTEQEESK